MTKDMEILLKALVRKGIFRTLEVQKIKEEMNTDGEKI